MLLKRILTTWAGLVLLTVAVSAQTQTGGLTVRSQPPGAEVVLKGDAVVAGVTPTTFQQQLSGEYRLTIKKYGYEKYKTTVVLDPSNALALDIKLTQKSRIKAAARSLFIPGWGQRYSDQKTKSFIFNFLACGAVATFFLVDDEFQYRNDLLKQQRRLYDSSVSAGVDYSQLQSIQSELNKKQKKAYDAENVRRAAIGAVIGVWGMNVLDALFFFPDDHATFSVGGLSLRPDTRSGRIGLTLAGRF
jgi:hypothetical protein